MKQFESFFWGIVAALGAVVFQLVFFILFSIFIDPTGEMSLAQFFLLPSFVIALTVIEEFFKYLLLGRKILAISSHKNFLFNVLLMGLGFFAVEFFLISTKGSTTQIQAIIKIAVLQIGTSAFMGYFVATKNARKFNRSVLALIFTVIFHFSYNLSVIQENTLLNYAAFLSLITLVLIDFALFSKLKKRLASDEK